MYVSRLVDERAPADVGGSAGEGVAGAGGRPQPAAHAHPGHPAAAREQGDQRHALRHASHVGQTRAQGRR